MELIPAIRDRLAQVDGRRGAPLASGFRAALWRAQHQAARAEHTVDDLRGYCLEALQGWRLLDERDENDYLRGYRQGFQAVLSDIRRAETSRFRY